MTERWQEIADGFITFECFGNMVKVGIEAIKEGGALRPYLFIEAEPACKRIAELEAELAALGAWSCESCGCRFGTSQPAALLDGVTQCSKCVEVGVLEAEVARSRRLHAAALTIIAQRMMPCPTGEADDVIDCTPFMERAADCVERRASEIRHLLGSNVKADGKVMNRWIAEQAGGAP